MSMLLTSVESPLAGVELDAEELELVLVLAADRTEDTDTRVRALDELASVDDPRAVELARRLLDDPVAEVRFWAVYALWQQARAGRVDRDAVLAPLYRAAVDDDGLVGGWWSVRKEALDALAELELIERADGADEGFIRHRLDELRFARAFVRAAGLGARRHVEVSNEVRVARRSDAITISFPWLNQWCRLTWDGSAGALADAIEGTAHAWAALLVERRAHDGATTWDLLA